MLASAGDALDIPATDKTVHVTGISIVRIADGRMVEVWQNWDMLGILEQIKLNGPQLTSVRP